MICVRKFAIRHFEDRFPPDGLTVVSQFNVILMQSKKISNDQELIQSDPTSCPQNQKGNN